MKVLLLFVDGFGIGKKDRENNPFFFTELKAIKNLFGDIPHLRKRKFSNKLATLVPTDARLGVPGLPQSGTGQTAIFCGINAPKIIGKHFGPYPYSDLKPFIQERNIFHQVKTNNKNICFANCYPRQFFEYIASGKTRFSVTTLSCIYSGVPLLKHEDLISHKGISADITGEAWNKFGYNVKPEQPFEAGKILYEIALQNDLTVFEYFLTDHAGHSQSKEFTSKTLNNFDGLLGGILSEYDKEKLFVIMISDHGNIEDISTKSHTLNPVPTILIGKRKDLYSKKIKSISDIYYVIKNILKIK